MSPVPTNTTLCCPLKCSDHGECVDCKCRCTSEWTGQICEEFVGGEDF